MKLQTLKRSLLAMTAVAFAACSPDGPIAPEATTPSFDIGSTDPTALVYLCKAGLDNQTIGSVFDFTVSAAGGDVLNASPTLFAQAYADLTPANVGSLCKLVWWGPDPSDDATVTITELPATGASLQSVRVWSIHDFWSGVASYTDYFPSDGSVSFTPGHGKVVIFKNGRDNGEGCTPGYWRQEHHYDNWVGYTPDELFSDVFGAGPAMPLGEAVQLEGDGNGPGAMMRHAVAALLNAASPDVDYGMTEEEIMLAVQDAFDSGDFEDLKDEFEELNESGCDLD